MIPKEVRDGIAAFRRAQHGKIISIIEHILGFTSQKSVFAVKTQ